MTSMSKGQIAAADEEVQRINVIAVQRDTCDKLSLVYKKAKEELQTLHMVMMAAQDAYDTAITSLITEKAEAAAADAFIKADKNFKLAHKRAVEIRQVLVDARLDLAALIAASPPAPSYRRLSPGRAPKTA